VQIDTGYSITLQTKGGTITNVLGSSSFTINTDTSVTASFTSAYHVTQDGKVSLTIEFLGSESCPTVTSACFPNL